MQKLGIILYGITGRMGKNQHLVRSIKSIRDEGGIDLGDGRRVEIDAILVGRNEEKLSTLSREQGFPKWTTNLDDALANPEYQVFFDSASTNLRAENVKKALEYGKHIYCEKPSAASFAEAKKVFLLAEEKKVRHGVVQDKLFLPGLIKLKRLIEQNFFGEILSVKIDFGYWVFTGEDESQSCQRPIWNYKLEEGGGIITDMMCHWYYIINNLFGCVQNMVCTGKTHIPVRYSLDGRAFRVNTDDACYAMVNLTNEALVQISSSWSTRVRRDDLATFHVDGTQASAVATLSECYVQSLKQTPRFIWNPDEKQKHDFLSDWKPVFEGEQFENGFKVQWKEFLKYILEGGCWNYGLDKSAEAVYFAELALESWKEKKWVNFVTQF